ncbi:hypothetical protein EV701_101224 [Chthoniobacter flavus]|uniref:hypothetical protein n=1 Tax=Chthoniobacter flavus TaxID=191863 RepID=UPI0010465D2D|nr:hypothetical protein [Chthoniobacter flavus]TCO95537.1 hypothetical protein EV701_101224 [Chthoniobacter flavus]
MGKLIGWMLYFGFLAAIVVIGWQQPLKVQFGLKPTPSTSAPTFSSAQPQGTPPSWMSDQRRWDTTNHATSAPATPPADSQSVP